MKISLTVATSPAEAPINVVRRRLYGLCVIVALSVWLAMCLTDEKLPVVHVYLPLMAAAMLAIGLAGAEWQVFLFKTATERLSHLAEQDEALDRQRAFNKLWPALADSRGLPTLPDVALQELARLFAAQLVIIWSTDQSTDTYRLRGQHPLDDETTRRLNRIVQASPCFDKLRDHPRTSRITDIARATSPALGLFCEERQFPQVVLCPVMVRQELVGVLGFFFTHNEPISAHHLEEMQSAANLFLCAL